MKHRSLLYSIGIIDNENEKIVEYIGLDGKATYRFNEIIAINPHNIEIAYVSCYNPRLNNWGVTIYHIDNYKGYQYNYHLDNIEDILNNLNHTMLYHKFIRTECNEVLHLIDLWLTKFVPYKK